ncbi:hypothetical protein JYU34_002660 [Plutella xylostella]|uniref:Cation/H+ exchanger transmembrane domain-containing protein n=1 Tax=Plutella xylostella TaxID=51655 RepID=A0ABQ7R2S3_PLUXY|nr:hypothetical protein JYU34_002660 [Plutella xylostella]
MARSEINIDAAFEIPRKDVEQFDYSPPKTTHRKKESKESCFVKVKQKLPNVDEIKQYTAAVLCGLLLWGSSWFLFKDAVSPGGFAFKMAAVTAVGYICGHTLERYTTITPMVGMTLVGAVYRTFGGENFLENPAADAIDFHLRRVYPVIILTRGPLTWNWEYIRSAPVRVFSLATLPWVVECLSVAVFAHLLLGFQWYWGIHLGAILSSVSPAVVVPVCQALTARGLGTRNKIGLLVGNAGGLDTAFTEGMFGVINTAIFVDAPLYYRIIKAVLAIFVGTLLGVAWGTLVDLVPAHSDRYAPVARSLLIFAGGLLLSYACAFLGWGGTSGVAIMVCAGTAATRWARRDWPINDNPVSEVYKLLWRVFEPMLFTLSGYYLDVSSMTLADAAHMISCILLALLLRLLAAFLVALANELSLKESLFIAVTWIPKAIVEAVLVRVATDSLWTNGTTSEDIKAAKLHSNIIVIAILITSTLGSILTTVLGPILLSSDSKVSPANTCNS